MCIIETTHLACEKGIKIVHINARSLFHKIEDIFTTFQSCDVIVITETWLKCSRPTSSLSVDGYSIIRQDRYMNIVLREVEEFVYMLKKIIIMKCFTMFVQQLLTLKY